MIYLFSYHFRYCVVHGVRNVCNLSKTRRSIFLYLLSTCSNRVQELNIKFVQLYMWKIYKVPVCRKTAALLLKLRERLHESDAF